MWKLKISKELLENLKSPNFTKVNSIKTYEFSTLNTTIPDKLKSKLFDIIDGCFFKKGSHKLTYVAKMLEFLIENINVFLSNQVFQQSVRIPMSTDCAPLLADFFFLHMKHNLFYSKTGTWKKLMARCSPQLIIQVYRRHVIN